MRELGKRVLTHRKRKPQNQKVKRSSSRFQWWRGSRRGRRWWLRNFWVSLSFILCLVFYFNIIKVNNVSFELLEWTHVNQIRMRHKRDTKIGIADPQPCFPSRFIFSIDILHEHAPLSRSHKPAFTKYTPIQPMSHHTHSLATSKSAFCLFLSPFFSHPN